MIEVLRQGYKQVICTNTSPERGIPVSVKYNKNIIYLRGIKLIHLYFAGQLSAHHGDCSAQGPA